MSEANRRYQIIKRYELARKAREYQEKKELQSDKYPHCRGTFDDCPSEAEMNEALKQKVVLRKCKICPSYTEK